MHYPINIFGQAYDTGTYGSSTYGGTTNTSTGASTSGSGGVLTNTGFDLVLAATVAVVLIFAALMIRFWKRPAKN